MLSISTDRVGHDLANFRFSEAYDTLYHFVWDDFADWYIEASKVEPNPAMLAFVLEQTLKLAHPFAPFITEAIWQELGWSKGKMLINESWPQVHNFPPAQAVRFDELMSLVSEVRWLRAMSGTKADRLCYGHAPAVTENSKLIAKLAGLKEVTAAPPDYANGIRLTSVDFDCWLDVDAAEAKDNLVAKLKEAKAEENMLKARLEKPEYKERAPKELVEQTKKALAEASEKIVQLDKILQNL